MEGLCVLTLFPHVASPLFPFSLAASSKLTLAKKAATSFEPVINLAVIARKETMPPVPEPRVRIDSDDEESLLLLANVERNLYSSINWYHEDSKALSDENFDERENKPSCLRRLWESYYTALEQHPLFVKSITALLLMGLADFLAQMVERLRGIPHEPWVDILRVMRFAVFGLLGAPWTHYYYDWLDTVLPPTPKPWTMTTAGESKF